MEADYGWDRWRAYDLLTHVARISVGYYALGTVAVKIEKRYLSAAVVRSGIHDSRQFLHGTYAGSW